MRVLILSTDYPRFINSLYQNQPGLSNRSFSTQWKFRAGTMFGMSDFYSRAFLRLGHDAEEVFSNIRPMIVQWARENGVSFGAKIHLASFAGKLLGRFVAAKDLAMKAVRERVKREKPELLINHDMNFFLPEDLAELKPYVKWIVGQHACTEVFIDSKREWIPFVCDKQEFQFYDLILSSMPSSVLWFKSRGGRAVLNRLAVDSELVRAVPPSAMSPGVSFIGSFSAVHSTRLSDLETVARNETIDVWAPAGEIPAASPLHRSYHGEAYGRSMYAILKSSEITINHHGNVHPHANNCRLYEATASGTFLLTDWKPDLSEIFDPEKEVAAFTDADDCIEKIRRFSRDSTLRKKIAAAGQRRCEAEHSYEFRIAQFLRELN